jgi:hypothetical protein
MNRFIKIKASYYDSQSIMIENKNIFSYYIPETKKEFRSSFFNSKKKEFFEEVFTELDTEIYEVNIPVVAFEQISTMEISDDDDDIDDISIDMSLVWDDISTNEIKFNKKGIYNDTLIILIKEHWSQCYEGDWDCYQEYIGVLNNKIDYDSLITKKSSENRSERIKSEEKYFSYIW